MPRSSTGEKLPLVTSPTAPPVDRDGVAGAWDLAALGAAGRGAGAGRRARARHERRPARGSRPCPSRTTQPRPAWSGVMPGPSSWPCSGARLPAGGCRGRRGRRADAGVEERAASSAPARRRGHVELDAVLAGVAGAGDVARRSPSKATGAPRTAERRPHRRVQRAERLAGCGTLDRDHRTRSP